MCSADAGFIDNLGTGRSDANTTRRARPIYVTWTPTDTTRVGLYVTCSRRRRRTTPVPGTDSRGPLQKRKVFRSREIRTTIHNLRLDQDLGFATLTATATYHNKRQYTDSDVGRCSRVAGNPSTPIHGLQWAKSQGSTAEVGSLRHPGSVSSISSASCRDDTREFLEMRSDRKCGLPDRDDLPPLFGRALASVRAPNDVFFAARIPFRGQRNGGFGEASYRSTTNGNGTARRPRHSIPGSQRFNAGTGILQLLTFRHRVFNGERRTKRERVHAGKRR